MFAVVMFDYRALASYSYPIYVAVMGLLVAVGVIGQATGGSRRWINLGLFTLEPSELAKLALILVLVRYLREDPPPGGLRLRHIAVPAILLAVPAVLVLKQPDLGTMLTMVLIFAVDHVRGRNQSRARWESWHWAPCWRCRWRGMCSSPIKRSGC